MKRNLFDDDDDGGGKNYTYIDIIRVSSSASDIRNIEPTSFITRNYIST
jgi:hypothetical protein